MSVTVRDITAAAGLNMVHITRYFGSRAELLFDVSEELNERLIRKAREEIAAEPSRVLGFEEVNMRLRVIMALRSEGFDMTRFQESEKRIFTAFSQFLVRTRGIDSTVADVHTVKILLVLQALNLMSEANGLSDDQISRTITLLMHETVHANESARQLGWL